MAYKLGDLMQVAKQLKQTCIAFINQGQSIINGPIQQTHSVLQAIMSLRQTRDQLLLALDDGAVTEEEFLLLYDVNSSENLHLPCDHPPFSLDDMEDDQCITEFRVRKADLPLLAQALRIPDQFRCPQRSVVGGMEGLCMLLKRLAYPCRYSDMMHRFGGRQVPVLSMAVNTVLDYIYDEHHRKITEWNPAILSPTSLQAYADHIHQAGAPLENCFGFIDGTVRAIARPGQYQQVLYNGHKRVHSLKFQSAVIPNGLIANLYGPVGKSAYITFIFNN